MSYGRLKRGESAPSFTQEEQQMRMKLLRLVKDDWPRELQDAVFLEDCPTAEAALNLVLKHGVRRAHRLIEEMNNDD